jgi:hypothetical protein
MIDLSIFEKIKSFNIKNSEYYDIMKCKSFRKLAIILLVIAIFLSLFAMYTNDIYDDIYSMFADKKNNNILKSLLKSITFILLFYESLRKEPNNLSYYAIYIFCFALGLLHFLKESKYYLLITITVFLSIIFFMIVHCNNNDSDVCVVILFIELFLFIVYMIEYNNKQFIKYKDIIMIGNFMLFYVWLDYIEE